MSKSQSPKESEPEEKKIELAKVKTSLSPTKSVKSELSPRTPDVVKESDWDEVASPEATNPKRLYLANFRYSINENDLENDFRKFGDIVDVVIQRDKGMRSRGFGFLTFATPEDAASMRNQCSEMTYKGRKLVVEFAFPQGEEPPKNTKGRQGRESIIKANQQFKTHGPQQRPQRGRGGRGYSSRLASPAFSSPAQQWSPVGSQYAALQSRYRRMTPRDAYDRRRYDNYAGMEEGGWAPVVVQGAFNPMIDFQTSMYYQQYPEVAYAQYGMDPGPSYFSQSYNRGRTPRSPRRSRANFTFSKSSLKKPDEGSK